MAHRNKDEKRSSLLGKVAKVGLAFGAVQLLRNEAFRSKVSETVSGLSSKVRKGAASAADIVESAT